MGIFEKFVGADTGKQLQGIINPIGLGVLLEVLLLKFVRGSINQEDKQSIPDRRH